MKQTKTYAPILGAWLVISTLLIWAFWSAITNLNYSDIDDGMRMLQVRALLDGQGWYDLVNHRILPPQGANIHWTRLVDLPIAGIILALRPFIGTLPAEQVAATLDPLLALLAAMIFTGITNRRISNIPPVLAATMMALCLTTLFLFSPLRIDHHNWQIAALAAILSGVADPNLKRGGITIGIATAVSLGIGLENLPYLAIIVLLVVWQWIQDEKTAQRLQWSGITLMAATAVVALLFMSEANRGARCDVLSPVWLTTVIAGGLIAAILPVIAKDRLGRIISTATCGIALIIMFALAWPNCIGAPEGLSQQAYEMWFQNISETKSIAASSWTIMLLELGYPVFGFIGANLARKDATTAHARNAWHILLIATYASIALMGWQVRLGYAIPVIAAPGSAYLVMWCVAKVKGKVLKTAAGVGIASLIIGIPTFLAGDALEAPKQTQSTAVNSSKCRTPSTYAALNQLTPGMVATLPETSPWILYASAHSASSVSYHREGDNIVRAYNAFAGSTADLDQYLIQVQARYLVVCKSNLAMMLATQAPTGNLARMLAGHIPASLHRLPQTSDQLLVFGIKNSRH